jgi:regulatory protein
MWRKRQEIKPESERVISDPERARERTMNRAVKLLAAKPRSVAELRERLLEKNWTNSAIVERVIQKLEEYKYLDDKQFASDLAVSKLRQKPQGKRKLQQSLSQKKLSKENVQNAITSAFEKLPENELIDKAIEKRLRLKGKPETREDSKKFYDHLLRQGFDFDLIRTKMNAIAKREIIDEAISE